MQRTFHWYLGFQMIFPKKTVQSLVEFNPYLHDDSTIFIVRKVQDNTLLKWFLYFLFIDDNFYEVRNQFLTPLRDWRVNSRSIYGHESVKVWIFINKNFTSFGIRWMISSKLNCNLKIYDCRHHQMNQSQDMCQKKNTSNLWVAM